MTRRAEEGTFTGTDGPPSDGPPPDGSPRPRVCCCLRPGEDRRLLVEWLEANGYEPVVAGPSDLASVAFDCCLVDVASLREAAPILSELRADRSAGIRPCLLIAPGDAAKTLERLPSETSLVVTDVLGTPLRRVVLRRRLESALSVRRLSRALVDSSERYRQLLERTPAAVFVLSGGEITYCNGAAAELLGRADEAIVGTRFLDHLTEPDRDRIADLIATLETNEGTEFVEASIIGQRRSIPVELAASVVEPSSRGGGDAPDRTSAADALDSAPQGDVQVLVYDVSRRKAREDQLRLYRRAMDAATVGITISNPSLPDNPVVYVNEELERLTGRSREEILGRNARMFQCAETDPETVARLRAAIDAGEPVSVQILNERADGSRWYNALDVTPIHGPDGTVEYFLGFQRDVTERREREARLAVLDRVLRHNLRNRLNVVLGHVAEIEDVVRDGEDRYDDVASHAERIRTAAEGLLSLSDGARRFRSILRSEADRDVTLRLDREVTNTASTVRSSRPEARIETSTEPTTVRSSTGLTVAVEELVMNAIDHCDRDPEVVVTVHRDGDEAVLSVADNGPGIPATERQALSGDEETPIEHASGLGLWLVRWVVNDVGGSVSYRDNDPHGAVVTLRLPVIDDSEG